MKRILLVIITISLCTSIFSQTLTVDAGGDKIFCKTAQGVIMNGTIGGNPTVSVGTAPYTYEWTAEHYVSINAYSASSFLNDTTIANPVVIDWSPTPPIKFYIIVTDVNGNQGIDSISVNFSQFGILPLSNDFYVTAGDTASINIHFGGGVPPYTYAWYPNYNISDTTVAEPQVWPNSDTFYFCTIKDAIGCPFTFNNIAIVHVYPVNTNTILQEKVKIYPNPTQDWLTVELKESQLKSIKITDMTGKIVLEQHNLVNNQLDISRLSLGVYILSIEDKEGNMGQFQILKE
jgi:hypothetical protein